MEATEILEGVGVVAHACNPNYSGGGYWEDGSSRPAQAKVCKTPSQLIKAGCGGACLSY
jgi:hypothetical protein